ncbi:Uncharacterised protein [Listeria grayi]|uniref:Uncharacterized protein n=1 Tax=Listeria grayi TaxID=1641 RepID=A0A378M9E2_LISGR|nr:Uncharacterised protein [Listeria grayi]
MFLGITAFLIVSLIISAVTSHRETKKRKITYYINMPILIFWGIEWIDKLIELF